MNTKYTIKNFRVFDEKGITVDIKPLTILTGCNSSGKSSIVKSMVLFNTFTNQMKEKYEAGSKMKLGGLKLDFTKKTTSDLGNFRRIIHNGSSSETIVFQYTIESKYLGENVIASFFFSLESSELNGGKLVGVKICKLGGETFFSSFDYDYSVNNSLDDERFNLTSIRNNFFRFVLGQDIVSSYQSYEMSKSVLINSIEHNHKYDGPTEKEFDEWNQKIENRKKVYCEKYGKKEIKKIISWFNDVDNSMFDNVLGKQSFIKKFASFDVVEKAELYKTLFFVPVYEELYELDKPSFRTYMDSFTQNNEIEFVLQCAIEVVVSSFEKSDYDTFGDFYSMMEHSFFEKETLEFWDLFMASGSDNYFFSEGINKIETNPVNFQFLLEVITNIDYLLYGKGPYYLTKKEPGDLLPSFIHVVYRMFVEYTRFVNNDLLFNKLHQQLSYIGTSIVNVKRLYSLEGNDDFTDLLRRYIEQRINPIYTAHYTYGGWYPSCFINKWIQKLGIGKSIGIRADEEGLGATIRLYKDDEDKKGSLLAEQGYGITQILVILLRIELAIMENRIGRIVFDDDLYMGKDTESHHSKKEYKETTIAIEEPEVHLHPKMQSVLAEIFVDAYTNYNVHFIIETHSEYIIRKLQLLVANKEVKNSDISILYVYDEKDKPGYEPQVKKIEIRKDGMLTGTFGEGFFDEADMLSMFLLSAQGDEE